MSRFHKSGPDDKGTEEKPKDEESTQDLRASQIVARGEERKEPEEVILAALAAAKVESNMKCLPPEQCRNQWNTPMMELPLVMLIAWGYSKHV